MKTITDYLKDQPDGVDVSQLPLDTKLFINTVNSLYELTILGDKQVEIFGGKLPNGETRFFKPSVVHFNGSTWGGSIIKIDWIGKGMRLEFVLSERKILTTAIVKTVLIEAPQQQWHYLIE